MKKYIILIFCLCVFSFFVSGCKKQKEVLDDLALIKKRGYIIVGVKTDSPPFGFYDDKKLVGLDIEIARNIANSIFETEYDGNIEFVAVNPQNRISKLNSKEVDILIATMSVNEKRKLVLAFSKPYFVAHEKIMVRKTSKIAGLRYFNSKGKIAVIMGTTGEKTLRKVAPNASVVGVKTYKEAVNLLANGKVDAILGDDCILAGFNKNKKFKIVNRAYSREFYAVALRKSPEVQNLGFLVDGVISELLDSKRLNFIKKRWISE